VGSLPRPHELIQLLIQSQTRPRDDRASLDACIQRAVIEAVKNQSTAGLDVINDGEQGRVDYTVYLKDRLTGFEGASAPPLGTGDEEFPDLAAILRQFASPFQHRPACTGPVAWKDWPAVEADIRSLKAAVAGVPAEDVFMTSPSPGQIARFLHNQYYRDDETYLYALADVMQAQYEAIVNAGFVLQLDCPDLALSRHTVFAHLPLDAFRKVIAMHVEALNHALRNLAPDRLRMHICWGSTLGPHHTDVPLRDVVDVVLRARPTALSFPGANPRHGHEWRIWKDVELPAEKILIPGVIDSTSNFVEHPELVAERIGRYASVVGRERVIAGVDCGFGTFAGRIQVDSKIVWLKLGALAEGARLASRELW
jgi:5-methyltetrahydropteroyltriglutamate--homocysteine methyltransferase